MLIPKDAPRATAETEPKPAEAAPESTPAPAPQPVEQPKPEETPPAPVEDKGFDKEVSMSKGVDVLDEMRNMTGEDPTKPWKPLIDLEKEETPEPKPTEEPKPSEQPKPEDKPEPEQGGTIKAGGKEFKAIEDLQNAYTNLQKDYHKKNFEYKQDKMSNEARMARLDNERVHLEKLLAANVALAADSGQAVKSGQKENIPELSREEFNEMIEGENGYEAVDKLIKSRLASVQSEQQANIDSINQSRSKIDVEITQNTMNKNVEMMGQRFDTFNDNRERFGEWVRQTYGTDEAAQKVVDNIVLDPSRLAKTYETYLKDTFDFSGALQNAKAEGQAVASVKETLQPIQSTTDAPPEPTKTLEPKADPEMTAMEMNLGVLGHKGSYFGGKDQGGLFR